MSQPKSSFMTRAMEYKLTPLIRTVMNAKVMADNVRVESPKRSFR
jgi:hypothetical protein